MLPYVRKKAVYTDTRNWLAEVDYYKLHRTKEKLVLRITVTPEIIAECQFSGHIDWSNIGSVDMNEVLYHATHHHPLAAAMHGIFPDPTVTKNWLCTGDGQEYAILTPKAGYLSGKWDSTPCEDRPKVFRKTSFDVIIWKDVAEKYNLLSGMYPHIQPISKTQVRTEKMRTYTDLLTGPILHWLGLRLSTITNTVMQKQLRH